MAIVDLLVLDLDGPLLDVRARYAAVHDALVGQLGLATRGTAAAFWELKRARTALPVLLGLPPGDPAIAAYRNGWQRLIEDDAYLALDKIQSGALEALRAIPPGVRAVLVSLRTNQRGAAATLERLGLSPHFDEIVWVAHAAGGKADAVRRVAAHTDAARVLVVGDTEVDLTAARAGGFPFVAVSCGMRSAPVLEALGAERVVPDLGAALARLGHPA